MFIHSRIRFCGNSTLKQFFFSHLEIEYFAYSFDRCLARSSRLFALPSICCYQYSTFKLLSYNFLTVCLASVRRLFAVYSLVFKFRCMHGLVSMILFLKGRLYNSFFGLYRLSSIVSSYCILFTLISVVLVLYLDYLVC